MEEGPVWRLLAVDCCKQRKAVITEIRATVAWPKGNLGSACGIGIDTGPICGNAINVVEGFFKQ
jgi:hypothetical protein